MMELIMDIGQWVSLGIIWFLVFLPKSEKCHENKYMYVSLITAITISLLVFSIELEILYFIIYSVLMLIFMYQRGNYMGYYKLKSPCCKKPMTSVLDMDYDKLVYECTECKKEWV